MVTLQTLVSSKLVPCLRFLGFPSPAKYAKKLFTVVGCNFISPWPVLACNLKLNNPRKKEA